ncbi:MAG TPA: choice-of-anchor tandem repeat GloVer-containing protein [Candidatus Cybelea sp.]|nr:choice-of-anchor tandem repeat GloVer-containing protein [Candidatus Cybelea sp.]
MRISASIPIAAFLSVAILTACGGNSVLSSSTPTSAARSQAGLGPRAAHGVTEEVLYSFAGGSDAEHPTNVTLFASGGTLYSDSEQGGGSGCQSGDGCGTVFKVSTSGVESVLYSFEGKPDGQYAKGGLVERSGVFYGTTQVGGTNGYGTFFKITTSGKETVLHSFGAAVTGGYDGIYPYGGIIYVPADDKFYGTTIAGGTGSCGSGGGCGTVFSVTPSGKETVLHSFAGGKDGDYLTGSLIYSNGQLYGTSQIGGGGGGSACTNTTGPEGCGTIFSVSTSGKEKVLYSFTGASDGAFPDGGFVDVNGTLYGMAGSGGSGTGCNGGGCGTIFSLSASGAFKAIYSFKGAPKDGASPFGNLTDVNGVLYGTTELGGASSKCKTSSGLAGCGVIFRVTTSGKEQTLYSFKDGKDGAIPTETLLYLNGVLYGTTHNGGSGSCSNGCGTVFSVSGF